MSPWASEAPKPQQKKRSWGRLALVLIFIVPNCFCCATGSPPPMKLYMLALFGWVFFVSENAPKVHVNPLAVATFAGTLVAATLGVHLLGSWLRRPIHPERPPWRAKWTVALMALFVLAFVAGIAALGVIHQSAWLATQPEPFLEEQGRSHARAYEAIGNLKTIVTSQSIYREGDKDENGVLDYGTLEQLGEAKLIDSVLASGTKSGYAFEVAPSVVTSEFLWFAVASPLRDRPDERFFFTNQSGQIFYTTDPRFRVDRVTCEVPPGFLRVGR